MREPRLIHSFRINIFTITACFDINIVYTGKMIYLNDMRYDFSRWSISLVDDFNLESEYMYQADRIWQNYVHPEDLQAYRKAVDTAICGNAQVIPFYYRARKADGTYVMLTTRAFILSDSDGNPDYFGGIIIPQ